jgi:hypothetical protein
MIVFIVRWGIFHETGPKSRADFWGAGNFREGFGKIGGAALSVLGEGGGEVNARINQTKLSE